MEKKENKKREVVEINGRRKVYHYLHNMASDATEAVREGDLLVFKLPNPNWQKRDVEPEAEYKLQIDERDQRTLVVFDGHIPWGGLPKNGTVVFEMRILELCVSEENVRKPNSSEETALWNICDNGKATLSINRHFLLLPKSVACVRRYDNKSLRPIYTFVEVNEKGVTWRTSSY